MNDTIKLLCLLDNNTAQKFLCQLEEAHSFTQPCSGKQNWPPRQQLVDHLVLVVVVVVVVVAVVSVVVTSLVSSNLKVGSSSDAGSRSR